MGGRLSAIAQEGRLGRLTGPLRSCQWLAPEPPEWAPSSPTRLESTPDRVDSPPERVEFAQALRQAIRDARAERYPLPA